MGFGFDFSGVGFYDPALFLNILAVFPLATIGFAFESAEFLFERTNFIDGLFHHRHQVQFLAIREIVAARDAQGLKVWDVESGIPIAKQEETGKVSALAFHPFKLLLATVAPNGTALRILDLSSDVNRWESYSAFTARFPHKHNIR
jgi:hypothetical protein